MPGEGDSQMQGQSSPRPQRTLGYRLLSSPQRAFGPWHLVWPHLPGLRFSLNQTHLPYVPPENPSITVCPAGLWGNPDAQLIQGLPLQLSHRSCSGDRQPVCRAGGRVRC